MPYYPPPSGGVAIGAPVTGGTPERVLYIDAAGNVAQDVDFQWITASNRLLVNGNVACLDVRLDGIGSAGSPAIYFNASPTTGIFSAGPNRLNLASNGLGRFEVSAAGHLIATLDAAYDIGLAGNRPRDLTISRNVLAGADIDATGRVTGATIRVGPNSLLMSAAGTMVDFTFGNSRVGLFVGSTNPGLATGAYQTFRARSGNHTNQTLSTEIRGFEWLAFTRQWATGAIANQRECYYDAPTYAFVGASTITDAATLYAALPIAGANCTITNNYAAWFGGKIRVDGGVALGGGAAPVVGTIGGAGPAVAAQNEWISIDTQNGVRFVPAWA